MDQQLQVFVTVAEEKNFTRAAKTLHISQPAISQYIQNLEQKMDVSLLDRTNKYVRLNPAGEVFYRYAKEMLGLYEQLGRQIRDLKEEAAGPLKIGSSFTFGEYVLPHVVADFRGRYSRIEPSITIENTQKVVELVECGELDVGIIEGGILGEKHVDVTPFADDTVVVVASIDHPLAAQKTVSTADVESECWIVREQGSGTREITDNVFQQFDLRPKTLIEYRSNQVIKESVEAGLGITLLSKWVIRKELMCKTMKVIPLSYPPIKRKFSLVLRKSKFETKASSLFRQFLLQQSERLSTIDVTAV
ncbi:LysR family transcriptional regulator [Alicyclobacillus sp. SO9]|uniref:LysR family transcriptional regulator n=1 Tax=Alicyclobacillus sp. SO9 TaxID=2665646 RepID=UPI0018E8055A|nr:LysR family transcriptional regulator [Alicyclobacillus sp. SO9]QQE80658.1 LysR family transcriptional regulator [Alicyclobacillus sp. SO9]